MIRSPEYQREKVRSSTLCNHNSVDNQQAGKREEAQDGIIDLRREGVPNRRNGNPNSSDI